MFRMDFLPLEILVRLCFSGSCNLAQTLMRSKRCVYNFLMEYNKKVYNELLLRYSHYKTIDLARGLRGHYYELPNGYKHGLLVMTMNGKVIEEYSYYMGKIHGKYVFYVDGRITGD